MSYRREILKRLKHFYDDVGADESAYLLLDPIDIIGTPGNAKYVAAINQLLREDFIRAVVPKGSNRPAFSLNVAKIEDINKELNILRSPTFIFVVSTLIALAGLMLGIVKFVLGR